MTWTPGADTTINAGRGGNTLPLRAVVEDDLGDVLANETVEGAGVRFAVNNSSVASLSVSEDVSNGDGMVSTTLTAKRNGTVRVYAVSGGASDVVTDGETGHLVDPDDPGGVADALDA